MTLKNTLARTGTLAFIVGLAGLSGCIETPSIPDMRNAFAVSDAQSATIPFTFDDNRVFVEVAFLRPDGGERKALAFVNMGSGALVLSNALYRELAVGNGPLQMRIGTMSIKVDRRVVQPEDMANSFTLKLNPFSGQPSAADVAKGPGGSMAAMSAPMNVEAVIPPGLLQNFQTTFDYGARTMTLAAPGAAKPEGAGVPLRINPQTGFATVDLAVDGKTYPSVIDNGGSYTVCASSIVAGWIARKPTSSWMARSMWARQS